MCPARLRAAGGEPAADVRMQQAHRFHRSGMPEDDLQAPVPSVLDRPQSIAMLDARAPAGDFPRPLADEVLDAGILADDLASPAVMVAGDP